VPELPEVETVVRGLAARVVGQQIVNVRFFSPRAALGQPDETAAALRGRRICRLRRLGKHILFDLDSGVLEVHLRMTGKLLWNGVTNPYTRAILELTGGALVFNDTRQFGYLTWRRGDPNLGPDALGIPEERFAEILRSRRGRIKPLLLNQSVISGLGNIYVDESLFRARIHPLAFSSKLSEERLRRLHRMIQEVLAEAIAAGGSSISDYVDAEGRPGWFQVGHRVYGRDGEPCVTCGRGIRRTVVGQRGTHFCGYCQRR